MTTSQYFEENPDVPSDPVDVDVVLPDLAFTMRTDTGVFSRGALDAGTRLLLTADLGLPKSGDFLDLGCGAGPIAITMALRRPEATVWALDVNERARQLCAANAQRAGAINVRVVTPSAITADLRFDAIWSNPPIRIGKAALHDLLETWLPRLKETARAHLVVQKHLGSDSLADWLTERGWPTRRVLSKSGYRILEVLSRPGTGQP